MQGTNIRKKQTIPPAPGSSGYDSPAVGLILKNLDALVIAARCCVRSVEQVMNNTRYAACCRHPALPGSY